MFLMHVREASLKGDLAHGIKSSERKLQLNFTCTSNMDNSVWDKISGKISIHYILRSLALPCTFAEGLNVAECQQFVFVLWQKILQDIDGFQNVVIAKFSRFNVLCILLIGQ